MKTYILAIEFKTTRQMLKGFSLLYINKSYLSKVTLNDYEKRVFVEIVSQKFRIKGVIHLLEKKKIITKGMTLTTITKEIEKEVLK